MPAGHFNIYIAKAAVIADQNQALQVLARHYFARNNMVCSGDLSFDKDSQGKPYFLHQANLHFSLSHSGDYWLAAFGSVPLGIDIQQHTRCRRQDLAKRFFHPAEDKWLAEQEHERFFDIWAAKESYVKYTGQGIDDDFGEFSVVDEHGNIASVNGADLLPFALVANYSACLCAKPIIAVMLFDYHPLTETCAMRARIK